MGSNSWFSMKRWTPAQNPAAPPALQSSQKTCLLSSTFSIVESMVVESTVTRQAKSGKRTNNLRKTDKPVANMCRRYRLYPSADTRKILLQWFGCVRKTYNWALADIKALQQRHWKMSRRLQAKQAAADAAKGGAKKNFWKPKQQSTKNSSKQGPANPLFNLSVIDLRKKYVNADAIPADKKYLTDCPKHVRDGALEDLVSAVKGNLTKQKEKPGFRFDLKFRSRKESQAITIPYESVRSILDPRGSTTSRGIQMYPTYVKEAIRICVRKRQASRPLEQFNYTCKMIRDRLGRFYLAVPEVRQVPQATDSATASTSSDSPDAQTWAALDPGVRTFQTVYSPTPGVAYKVGHSDISRIQRLCVHMDSLHSKLAKLKGARQTVHNKRRNIKCAIERMRLRMRHLVDEVHWKTIHFLTSQFNNIIIPPFQVSGMVTRGTRRINKKTVRQMLTWRHYEFRQRLITKAMSLQTPAHPCQVYVCGEEYTSKTCTACFKLHPNLGGSKTFACPHCGVRADRDAAGSRNIFLKNVTVSHL